MISVASIVEGHGELSAVPLLLRRLAAEWEPNVLIDALTPIRVSRDKFLNDEDELKKKLLLAAAKSGEDGWILIILDADDDCPATLGEKILRKAKDHVPHRRVSVVLANREFEAWFIAAAHSLNGVRGFSVKPGEQNHAENPRNAKDWMRERMASGTYKEILDQPAFTARIDLQQAYRNSRSFRKLCKEWCTHVSERA